MTDEEKRRRREVAESAARLATTTGFISKPFPYERSAAAFNPVRILQTAGKHVDKFLLEDLPRSLTGNIYEGNIYTGLTKKHVGKEDLFTKNLTHFDKVIGEAYEDLTEKLFRDDDIKASIDLPVSRQQEIYDPVREGMFFTDDEGRLSPAPPMFGTPQLPPEDLKARLEKENIPELMEQRQVERLKRTIQQGEIAEEQRLNPFRSWGEAIQRVGGAGIEGLNLAGSFMFQFPELGQIALGFLTESGPKAIWNSAKYLFTNYEGDVFPDYNTTWAANSAFKTMSKEAESYIKTYQKQFAGMDKTTAEHIFTHTIDLMMPATWPGAAGKLSKHVEKGAQLMRSQMMMSKVGEDGRKGMEGVGKFYEFYEATAEQAIRHTTTAAMETQKMKPLYEKLTKATESNSTKEIDAINKEINESRAELYGKGLKYLFNTKGKWKTAIGAKWWEMPFEKAGETIVAAAKTGKKRPDGSDIYRNVLLTNAPTMAEREFRKQYRNLIEKEGVIAAGAATGTWGSYFEDTPYEDFKYAFGLLGIFIRPSVVGRLLENTADVAFGTFTRELPFTRTFFGGTLGRMLDMKEKDDKVGVSLPYILALGAKWWYKQKGRDFSEFWDSSYYKRLGLMSRGQPFYKVLAADDKISLKILGKEANITELDQLITLHGVNLRAMNKIGETIERHVGPEFTESAQQLFLYTKALEKRLQELGQEDALDKFIITAEQWNGAIRAQVLESGVSQMYKDGSLGKGLFGRGGGLSSWMNEGSILNILRTANQETTNQIEYLKKALNNLTGGDPHLEREFVVFKRMVNMWVAKAEGKQAASETRLKEIADKSNVFFNLEHEMKLNDILTRPASSGGIFDLEAVLGAVTGNQSFSKLAKFGTDNRDMFDTAHDMQKQANDFRFEEVTENYHNLSNPGNADDFVDALESLRQTNLTELGDLLPVLKDTKRLMAFGSGRTIETGQQSVESIIAFARYNGLRDFDLDTLKGLGDDLHNRGLVLTIQDKTYKNIANQTSRLVFHETRQGTIDLEKTLAKMMPYTTTQRDGSVKYHKGYAQDSGFGNRPDEYLRLLLSRIDGGNDVASRQSLKDIFSHELQIGDMHRIRSNFSTWSNKRQGDQSAYDVWQLVERLDDTFDKLGIPEIARANTLYRDWKASWKETDIGQNVLSGNRGKSPLYRAGKSLRDDELLELFLRANNPKAAKEIFDSMFGDIADISRVAPGVPFKKREDAETYLSTLKKEAKNIEGIMTRHGPSDYKEPKYKITRTGENEYVVIEHAPGQKVGMGAEKEKLQRNFDVSLGYTLFKNNGRIVSGNIQKNLLHLKGLRDNEFISERAYEDATEVMSLFDQASKYNISRKIADSENWMHDQINRLSRDKQKAIQESLGVKLKDLDTNGIFDMFVPQFRSFKDGLTQDRPLPFEGATGKAEKDPDYEKLRILTAALRDKIEGQIGKEGAPKKEDMEEAFSIFAGKPSSERVDHIFNVFIKDVLGITDASKITKSQRRSLVALRDILVSTAVKRSGQKLNIRRPAMDEALRQMMPQPTFTEKWMPPISNWMNLSSDVNLAQFGVFLEDMWPTFSRINNLLGQNRMTDDIIDIFEGLVAVSGDLARVGLTDAIGTIPRGITIPAATSRVYSGMRGVVSWKYLATEQIVREQQRRKSLLLHAMVTDPEFVHQLSWVVAGKKMSKEMQSLFVKKVLSIMGGRAIVYNSETQEIDREPSDADVIGAMHKIMTFNFDRDMVRYARKKLVAPKEIPPALPGSFVAGEFRRGPQDTRDMSLMGEVPGGKERGEQREQEGDLPGLMEEVIR